MERWLSFLPQIVPTAHNLRVRHSYHQARLWTTLGPAPYASSTHVLTAAICGMKVHVSMIQPYRAFSTQPESIDGSDAAHVSELWRKSEDATIWCRILSNNFKIFSAKLICHSCYCGVAFCYDCGGPWMMCSCRNGPDPLEDIPAGFLLNLDRNVVGLPEGMRQRAERVGQAAQERRRRGRDSVTRLYELLRQDRLDQHLWNPEVHRPSQGAFRPTSRRGQQPERSGRLVTLRSLRRAAGTPQNHLNLRLNTVWNPVARDVGRDYVEVANAELIRRFTERGNEGRDNQGVDEP